MIDISYENNGCISEDFMKMSRIDPTTSPRIDDRESTTIIDINEDSTEKVLPRKPKYEFSKLQS